MARLLSPTQEKIVGFLAKYGGSYRNAAEQLGMNEYTLKHHINMSFMKTGTHNKAGLIRWYLLEESHHDIKYADDMGTVIYDHWPDDWVHFEKAGYNVGKAAK